MNDFTYTTIPTEILHNKQLSFADKVIYCDIRALARQEGYCWASNSYFAKLYDISPSYVSKSISRLKKLNYITYTYDKKQKNEYRRRIYINYRVYENMNINEVENDIGMSL